MPARMKKKERQERILAELRARTTVRIAELAADFGVTTETVRRDLDELTSQGLVDRAYGGAASRSLLREPAVCIRDLEREEEKERIARAAMSLVSNGDALMIDSGSTTARFARRLAAEKSCLTVITKSISVASFCAQNSTIHVLLCPGDFNGAEGGVYGAETVSYLKIYHVNKAIIGAGGLSVDGVTDMDPAACDVKRAMLSCCDHGILLSDSGKSGARLLKKVCELAELNDVVTDTAPDAMLRDALAGASVKLHIAG